MFSELPKLFDRDFAIGFFLPVACFLAALYGLLAAFHLTNQLKPLVEPGLLIGTTIVGLVTWLCGVLLLVLNRLVYRCFQGYLWPLNTAWAKRVELDRRKWLIKRVKTTMSVEKKCREDGKPSRALTEQGNKMKREYGERFPDLKHHVLATAFGNTIRAFERYPNIMYGIDGVLGWSRLLTVIPKDFRQLVDAAKAQTDFWVNIWLLSYLFLGTYIVFVLQYHHLYGWWQPLIAIAVAWISSLAASAAARGWGLMFKTAFDVYLPALHKKMGFLPPTPPHLNTPAVTEVEMWEAFSQAIVFSHRPSLPPRNLVSEKVKASEEESDTPEASEEESEEDDNENDEDDNDTDDEDGSDTT